MFESLNDRMSADENKIAVKERFISWITIIVGAAVLLFGGMYIGLYYFQTS